MYNLSDKFTQNLKNALYNAYIFAEQLNSELKPEHILYSLSLQKGSVSAEILNKFRLNAEKIKRLILAKNANASQEAYMDIKINNKINIQFSPQLSKLLIKTISLSSVHKHKYIGTEHCLYALLLINYPIIDLILEKNKVKKEDLQEQIKTIFNSTTKFSEVTELLFEKNKMPEQKQELPFDFDMFSPKKISIDAFINDLTSKENQKKIDPVIARENEIDRLIQILCRRTKNNPVLLGDPGVGKTAIVEGLAKKIYEYDVPDILIGKKILTVDINSLVAGTSFRGEFEGRLKQLIDEVKKDENTILFIDEIHNIIGAGSASGSMDAANILKPFLAKGQIRCIGATTYEEYKKHIENDPALERRFQPININEPDAAKTIEILNGLKKYYEQYHDIQIEQGAINTAVALADRYLHEKFFPDKAIDLIDEACSKIKIKNRNSGILARIKKLENYLEQIDKEKEKQVQKENFENALAMKTEEEECRQKIAELKKIANEKSKKPSGAITSQDIISLVGSITKIPVSQLIKEEKNRLLDLENILGKKIIGQKNAIKTIANCIQRSRAGISNPNSPIGSFIFLGPSGVGKTYTAKILAETIFSQKTSLIQVDMSEFAEKFNVSRLIGSPPGYVGYKEGGRLTEAVRRNPYSVILFDEIEKAHPEVFNILLQILDEGQMTDAAGKKINFKNTIIIMTSNLGAEKYAKQNSIGFQLDKNSLGQEMKEINTHIEKELKNKFKPEFLNRVDKFVIFNPLRKQDIEKIIELELQKLAKRLGEKNLSLDFSPQVISFLARKSFSYEKGARLIEKNIQELIETIIAQEIIKNEIINNIRLNVINNTISLHK